MLATINPLPIDDFKPLSITIIIQTERDLEILHRLFNSEVNRQGEYVNAMYNNTGKIDHYEIDKSLDPIYQAIQKAKEL